MTVVNIGYPVWGYSNENVDLGNRLDPPPLSAPSSGTSISMTWGIGIEILASQKTSQPLRDETTGNLRMTPGTLRDEFLDAVTTATGVRDETLASQGRGSPIRDETLAAQRSSLAYPLETTGSVAVVIVSRLPLETITSSRSGVPMPTEWKAAVLASMTDRLETLTAATIRGVLGNDFLAAQTAKQAARLEWQGAVQVVTTTVLPVEWLAGQARGSPLPNEFKALLTASRPLPAETLARATISRGMPDEIVSGVRGAPALPTEFRATLRLAIPAPLETLMVTTAVVTSSRLPIEWLASQAATAHMAAEAEAQLRAGYPVLLEFQGAAPPTPGNRILVVPTERRAFGTPGRPRVFIVPTEKRKFDA